MYFRKESLPIFLPASSKLVFMADLVMKVWSWHHMGATSVPCQVFLACCDGLSVCIVDDDMDCGGEVVFRKSMKASPNSVGRVLLARRCIGSLVESIPTSELLRGVCPRKIDGGCSG